MLSDMWPALVVITVLSGGTIWIMDWTAARSDYQPQIEMTKRLALGGQVPENSYDVIRREGCKIGFRRSYFLQRAQAQGVSEQNANKFCDNAKRWVSF